MVAIEVSYVPEDDDPTLVQTKQDLDDLLDRLVRDGEGVAVPPMVELFRDDPAGWVLVYLGINGDRGFISHTGPTGAMISDNGSGSAGFVSYDYMSHVREIPARAEIALSDVRRAAHEFLATGGRSESMSWSAVVAN